MWSGDRHGGLTEPSRHHGGAGPLRTPAGALSTSLSRAGSGGGPSRYRARAVSPHLRDTRGQLPAESWEPEPDFPVSAPPLPTPKHPALTGATAAPRAAPHRRTALSARGAAGAGRSSPQRRRPAEPSPPQRRPAPGAGPAAGGGPAAGRGLPGPLPAPHRCALPGRGCPWLSCPA